MDGFKIADAYVEVHLKDNTRKSNLLGASGLVRNAGKAGSQAGTMFSRQYMKALSTVTAPANALFGTLRLAMMASAGPALAGVAAGFGLVKIATEDAMKAVQLYQEGLTDPAKMKQYEQQMARMTEAQRQLALVMIREVNPAIAKLKKTASANMLDGITGSIKGLLTLMPQVHGATDRMSKQMGDSLEELGRTFASAKFAEDLDGLFRSWDPLIKSIGDGMNKLVPRVVQFGKEMKPATDGISRFITHLSDGLTGAMDELAPHSDAFGRMWDAAGRILKVLLPIVGDFAGTLAEMLAPALEIVADFLEKHKEELKALVPVLAAVVLGMKGLNIIKSVTKWVKALTFVLGPLRKKLNGVNGAITGGKDGKKKGGGLFGPAALIGGMIGGTVLAENTQQSDKPVSQRSFGEAASDAGHTAGMVMSLDISGVIDKIKSDLRNLPAELDVLVEKFTSWRLAMGALFTRVWNDFTTWIGGIPGRVGGWLSDIWNQFTTWIGGLPGRVGGWLLGVWNSFTTWVGGLVGRVGGWLSDIWNRFTTWVGGLPGRVSGWLSGIWNSFTSWIGSLPGRVGGWLNDILARFRSLPGQIRSALGSLPGLLVGAGRSLIEGLWRGFSSAVGWVKSKISGALQSIRNLFPFSPAKEGPFSGTGYTTYSGRAMAEDFAKGMTSTTGTVKRAATSVLGPAAVAPRAGGASGGAGGARGAEVRFVGNTSDALASVIQHMIRTGKIQIA